MKILKNQRISALFLQSSRAFQHNLAHYYKIFALKILKNQHISAHFLQSSSALQHTPAHYYASLSIHPARILKTFRFILQYCLQDEPKSLQDESKKRFYVFWKALKFFFRYAEFVLKLCKKCAEVLSFLRFLNSAEIFLRICWICTETLQEMRWNFIVFRFSQKHIFLRMSSICAKTLLELRWSFNVFTFSQKRWNFSKDVLNLCWNFVRNALSFYCFYVFSKAL